MRYSGGDAKRLEDLSRYKTETDWANSWFEQRAALSKRAAPVTLPENATPEQVADYRKGLGVSEVAADAKPEAFLEAYKIKAPEGYAISEVEKGLIGDFAKLAYDKGYSPREVRESVDFFFKAQAANQQSLNKLTGERHKAWSAEIKAELGDQYEPTIKAADTYLRSVISEDDARVELLNAQLPGGGLLGNHPAFVKLISDMALSNGYTDTIEAHSMESTGRSLAEQQRELEGLRNTNRAKYDDPATQERLMKIIASRQSRGEIDEFGRELRRA